MVSYGDPGDDATICLRCTVSELRNMLILGQIDEFDVCLYGIHKFFLHKKRKHSI